MFLQRLVRNEAEEVEFLHGPLNDQPSSSPSIIKCLDCSGFLNPRIYSFRVIRAAM